jgi:hypothetical protein
MGKFLFNPCNEWLAPALFVPNVNGHLVIVDMLVESREQNNADTCSADIIFTVFCCYFVRNLPVMLPISRRAARPQLSSASAPAAAVAATVAPVIRI